ncbi:methyltransferase domain-containing protein [uncultured Serinicoccus sp.]|uniref:methyltransferase domain-containing protein n=1 Tax=uncultured Serinicoccus sp. TaxID=735514 RepID=UPI00261048D1|nr:methyltransferase domain-containing protein [uncultured Serinicoccus sp.]
MSTSWDPGHYRRYAAERDRPFVELMARVPRLEPRHVVDLGCGPGHGLRWLADRWPGADVLGLDSSPEMVAAARETAGGGRARAEVGDLVDWARGGAGPGEVDLLVTTATLQWVPGHLALLPELVGRLRPGGVLAMTVPGNMGEPSHTRRREIAARPRYAAHLAGVPTPAAHDPVDYLRVLAGAGCEVDAWETTYLHVLDPAGDDPDPVFTWVSATGARPTLQALPPDLREDFADELRAALRAAYPRTDAGVVLPFRRVFAVATREDSPG